jgi:N utilization substance protein B
MYALQALYQWQLSGNDIHSVEEDFLTDYNFKKTDVDYFRKIIFGVEKNRTEIDQNIIPYLDRSIDELTPTELVILRLSTFELMHCLDVPYKVVINEAIELGKTFGATEAHKFINGVLDKSARKIRTAE